MPATELSNNQINSVNSGFVVLDFWADWAAPCAQLNQVFDQLSTTFADFKFVKVQADNFDSLTEKYGVTAVPTFVFLRDGQAFDKVEGANGAELAAKLAKHAPQAKASSASANNANNNSNSNTGGKQDLNSRLEKLINFAPVMLFMKGVPEKPQCGFSNKIVDLLKKEGAVFSSFNILSDEEVRQGLKEYSNWPTFPQLYINGKLIGGLDIVRELSEEGELAGMLPKPSDNTPPSSISATPGATAAPKEDLNTRLTKLVNFAPVMLFMKGSPEQPQCGFSNKIVDILKKNNVQFSSFNILADEEVRQGLKTFSNWPTFPQLYSKGKLIGGLDIVKELAEEGQLLEALQ